MSDILSLSVAEPKMQKMTMNEFEERAAKFVENAINNLQSNPATKEDYTYDEALKQSLKQSFHRFVSQHYVLTEPKPPSP